MNVSIVVVIGFKCKLVNRLRPNPVINTVMKEETWISAGEMLCAKTWRRKDAT